jgi:hypothetical protein
MLLEDPQFQALRSITALKPNGNGNGDNSDDHSLG